MCLMGMLLNCIMERYLKKGNKRVKRFECIEVKTGKLYLFNPNAEVELLK